MYVQDVRNGSLNQSISQGGENVNTQYDSLPELDPQGEGINGPPDVSIGAMRNQFERQVVPSQTNMIDSIDTQNLSPEDIEAQGGVGNYTHERVTHAEQQYNADRIFETESVPEVEARLLIGFPPGQCPLSWGQKLQS